MGVGSGSNRHGSGIGRALVSPPGRVLRKRYGFGMPLLSWDESFRDRILRRVREGLENSP